MTTGTGQPQASSLVQRGIRALTPYAMVPLCLLASVLSAAPWLRSFPTSLAGAPVYGAAILAGLVPIVVVRTTARRLWLSICVDVVLFVVYTLLVVLRDPSGFGALWTGLWHGPSQILTFALPLVSPRSLMVAPVALVWLTAALAGECLARRWYTLLPYAGFLVSFGLAYAATQRASGSGLTSTRPRETLLAAALLVTLLLVRVAQAWVRQDESAETSQPDGVLPLRGLVVGSITALVVALVAAFAVQNSAFPKRAATPQRVPSIDQTKQLTPLGFVAGLRPSSAEDPGHPVFTVTTDATTPGYFAIANVDYYDGAGWTFDRTFRPSGGVLPDDTDPALQPHGTLNEQYRIADGPLAHAPWLPFVYRAQRVTGAGVDIDPTSGMIVPANPLAAGTTYTVRSGVAPTTFDRIRARTASPDTATPTIDSELPGSLRTTLDQVIQALSQETHTPTSPALPFLQALQHDLQTNYTLSGAAQAVATGTVTASPPPTTAPAATTAKSAPRSAPKTTPKSSARSAPAGHSSSRHHPRDASHSPLPHGSHAKSHPSGSHPSGSHPSGSHAASHSVSSTTAASSPTPGATPSSSAGGQSRELAGSTGFADVIASILGPNQNGTPEQFATLLALIARDLGVPARVVTGFRVVPPVGTNVLPAGRYDVTTADAWSWVEIPVSNVGWVVLDGSPAKFSADKKPTESGAPPPSSSSAPPSRNPLITAGHNGGHAAAPPAHIPHSGSSPTHALLIGLLVAIVLLIAVVLAILLSRKRVRAARRRRSPDPRLRVVGAWQENLDMLAETGLPDLSALTSAEIAGLAGEQFGPHVAAGTASLGAAANSVVYSSAVPDDAAAADAWRNHRVVRKEIGRQLGLRGRVAAGLRYRRPGRVATRPVSPSSWADSADQPATATRSGRRRHRAH